MPRPAVQEDHRSRVGAARRARMHRKLVESALLVFAELGIDASVIEDVIKAAEVSRGTFYNYFRTNADLLVAANEELSNEIAHAIEMNVGKYPSPLARLVVGIRLYLEVARQFPLFARFLSRAGSQFLSPSNLLYSYLPMHLEEGMKANEFAKGSVPAAVDVIVGSGILAVARISEGKVDADYLESLLTALMRSLGASEAASRQLIAQSLPVLELGEDSLLVRSHKRYSAQRRTKSEGRAKPSPSSQ